MTGLNLDHVRLIQINERNEQAGGLASNMTLRDKFAGQAVANHMTQHNGSALTRELIAEGAYRIADAMLEARKVKGEDK
jgi:hypothetical protein